MGGFLPKLKAYDLTVSRVKYWHARHPHFTEKPLGCVFCDFLNGRGAIWFVADWLVAEGFGLVKVGRSFIRIEAKSKSFRKLDVTTTEEVDRLYKLVSGRE